MTSPVITLTTDFGLKDPYVAEMKAVILSICPDANIVDISHQVEKFNIRMGAHVLASASPYFPRGTVHVAVVDPGVGTKRRPLCIETKNSLLVGPDNGILILAAKAQTINHVYEITNRQLMLPLVSSTFQGRDLFAPVAAHLANRTAPSEVGPETRKLVIPEFAKVARERYKIVGEVIHIDDFGNVITNISEPDLERVDREKEVKLRVGESGLNMSFRRTYGEAESKNPFVLVGSHGFLELSINQGNAARKLKVKIGDKFTIYHS
jgi:hypothetical protein